MNISHDHDDIPDKRDGRDEPGADLLFGLAGMAGMATATDSVRPPDPPGADSLLFPGRAIESSLERAIGVVDLEQPRFEGMPVHPGHYPGYLYFLHRRHGDDYDPRLDGPRSSASGVMLCMEHSGTHIDALSHQAENGKLFGGSDVAACNKKGFREGGVERIPPIVRPAVLLDVARTKGVPALDAGHLVSAVELQEALAHAKTSIQPGDVVLVRTGNGTFWRQPDRYLAGPGLAAEASAWLADKGVFAVGADNMAWDLIGLRDPSLNCELPGHLLLLARRGIYIMENLALENLSAAGVSRFTFVCTPLKLTGATGSPVRPIAILS